MAETIPRWSQTLAPIAERVAHTLGRAIAGKYVPATPLTGTSHRKAQAVVKARRSATRGAAKSTTTRRRASGRPPGVPWSCPDCGGPVTNHRHVRCDECIAADPRQTAELRGRRGAAIASRKLAQQKWEAEHCGETRDPDYFQREILLGLAGVKLADIVEAAGISKAFASQVRAGKLTPHGSTWSDLARLAEEAEQRR